MLGCAIGLRTAPQATRYRSACGTSLSVEGSSKRLPKVPSGSAQARSGGAKGFRTTPHTVDQLGRRNGRKGAPVTGNEGARQDSNLRPSDSQPAPADSYGPPPAAVKRHFAAFLVGQLAIDHTCLSSAYMR
jgi:hypothetical protein